MKDTGCHNAVGQGEGGKATKEELLVAWVSDRMVKKGLAWAATLKEGLEEANA